MAAELGRQSDASALAALHDLTDLVPTVGNKNAGYFAARVADAHKHRKRRRWIRTAAIIYSVAFVALLGAGVRGGGIRTCAPCSASPSP